MIVNKVPTMPLSNTQLLNLLHSLPDLKFILDRNLCPVFSKAHGFCRKTQGVEDYRSSAMCDPDQVKKVFATGKSLSIERKCPSQGRTQVHLFPICDEFGTSMVGICHHEAKMPPYAKNPPVDNQIAFESIIHAAPLATIALDNNLNVIYWNAAAEKILGWKKEDIIGQPYPILATSYRNEILENLQRIRQEAPRFLDTQRIRKDGTLIDVSLSCSILKNNQGLPIGYVAIMADITARKEAQRALKESEANYRTIFDAANDAHFVFDAEDATILDVNLKMCEMYGFKNREEALKHNVEEMMAAYPPYTLNDLLPLIWKSKDGRSQNFEWLAKHTSGRFFWMEVVMKGIVISGEYKVLAVVRDIMERKAREEEKKRMQQSLLQADKMAAIGTMASGIAHEINNPNNFILSNSQFLSDSWKDIIRILSLYWEENGEFHLGKMPYSSAREIIPKMLKGVSDGANRIKNIITALKSFSRQEKISLEQTVDINKVIKAALLMLRNKISKHTDYFNFHLEEKIPLVKGNFQLLEQVIVNLSLNALESLPSRKHSINISTSYLETENQTIIKVQDEGIGIKDDAQNLIFDPFFTTKFEKGGTGLGLSICFTIIKKHKGTIECFSKYGEGTIFTIRIPAEKCKNGEKS
jgi:PAS domain S-box-containing protein